MWFKNLSLLRFSEPFTITEDKLETDLQNYRFRSCGSLEISTYGWVSPLGRKGKQLAHSSSGFIMICAAKEEKILPASVINELVAERAGEIEDQQARRISKKERDQIRDDVIFELLPRAFTHTIQTYAYIDPRGGWLVIDAGNSKKSDEFVSLLRKSLGSLPVIVPNTKDNPQTIMTDWIARGNIASDMTLEKECELRSPDKDANIVRCTHQDLSSPEIQSHLDAGKKIFKIAANWKDRITFILDGSLNIKRLRFLDLIQDQAANIQANDDAERFDADFTIMALELSAFLPKLLELFGGEEAQNAKP